MTVKTKQRETEQFVETFGPLGFKWEPPNGSVPLPASSTDAAYLNFMEGMRLFEWQRVEPLLRPAYERALAAFRETAGREPESAGEVREMVDGIPVFQWRNYLYRTVQEKRWARVVETYRKQEAQFLEELEVTDRQGPGSVRWDPEFAYPDYARVEIHLQPGGYTEDPLAGYHYHLNTNLGFVGLNNNDGVQRSLVQQVRPPDDGMVRRALDLGCSVGQSTTALKEKFPDAEIWGIDLSSPMVRYAHRRAVRMGHDVHFAQMAAEQLDFPDNHFDVVYAYLLFHEIPAAVSRQVIREALRVLRPGGMFNVVDYGRDRYRSGTPYNTYLLQYMVVHNQEYYAEEFCTMDFEGELERAGFARVEEKSTNGMSQIRATK